MPRPAGSIRHGLRTAAVVALIALASTTVAASGVAAPVAGGQPPGTAWRGAGVRAPDPVAVQVLAVNDFHGALEPPAGPDSTVDGVPAGGVEFLAARLAALARQAQAGNTVTVAAGDVIGASPLLSAAFHDEPAVEALGTAGLDLVGIGNHEFDEGIGELLRMQRGGCHPVDGCADPQRPYPGARFRFLAANAVLAETGQPVFAPYAVEEVDGVRVGFIGMTLEGTPGFVARSGVAGVGFADEVATGNRYAAELQRQGVEAIVVLLHEGGAQAGGPNDCTGLTGPVGPIVEGLSDAVDVVVSGHTHRAYNCVVDGKLLTSAGSNGRLITDIDLRVDPVGGDVVAASASNVVVTRDLAPDPRQTELIARYRALLGPGGAHQLGTATAPITRTQRWLDGAQRGESALGELVADAQLAATDTEQGAVAAFVHPGGLRADLDAGPVLDHEAFAVQPFNNHLITLDLTGAQLDCLLEQQFATGRTLQPSAGVHYTVDRSAAPGTAADPCAGRRVDGLTVGGVPVDPAGTYRITVNDFLADGGDGFSVLLQGANRVDSGLDLEALAAHLSAGPVGPPALDRITVR